MHLLCIVNVFTKSVNFTKRLHEYGVASNQN